ncbi:MAG: helix-turn-helix domain-containing protein [Patescibacteria group bacterium]
MISPQVFEEMGFTEKETKVYLALLAADTATPAQVSATTRLNRTSCYDILTALVRKGLVTKFKKRGKQFFHASDPRSLLSYLENEKREVQNKIARQEEKVREMLPELASLLQLRRPEKPKMEFFEGEKGMREAYEDTLNAKDVYHAYANFETMHEALPNFFPEYYARRVKAGILGRGIFPRNAENLKQFSHNKQEMREAMVLPDVADQFTPEIIIYNDTVLIVSWREQYAIRIVSRELAQCQRVIFGQLWKYLAQDPKARI